MLKATKHEREHILGYMLGEAPDEPVHLAQKVYSEQVHTVKHDIWDVHTDRGRWWVITNPTKLYSQEQFPNMDLALTFHIGLCMRIPRSEEPSPADLALGPLVACWRTLDEANEALRQAEEVEDFQAVGMRCREALNTLGHVAQDLIPFSEGQQVEALGLSGLERGDGEHDSAWLNAPRTPWAPEVFGRCRLEVRQLADAPEARTSAMLRPRSAQPS